MLTVALTIYYLVLIVSGERGADANRRQMTFLNLGSQTSSLSGSARPAGDNLVVTADAGRAEATWNSYSYEIGHLAGRARACDMSVAILGVDLTSATAAGSADVLVNGNVVRHITFSSRRRGLFPIAPNRLVPADAEPQAIEVVPLDSEFGFVVPIPASYCSAQRLSVGVRVTDSSWTISRAGVILRYVPAPISATSPSGIATIVAGAALLLLLLIATFAVVRNMAELGTPALAASTLLLLLAPLAYDQWDYRLWLSFSEVASFGGGDPANLWYGSPLWTFVPPLFSTITAASYAVTGHGAEAITAILMKVAMGLAYCYTAYGIAFRAPQRVRSAYAIVALLVPVGLYELAGGYRELFATALVIASMTFASRRRPIVATVFAVVAASISEEFLPLVLFPATLVFFGRHSLRSRSGFAIALAVFGAALFFLEWAFFVPHGIAANALTYRFGEAPLGGASWTGALDGLHLLPAWLPARAAFFSVALFFAIAIFPAGRLLVVYRARTSATSDTTFDGTLGVFIAFVAAFLVAFRGTDPNLWYSLTAIVLWYFASADPFNPYPLVLGTIEGLAFYATVGFRDFVNQTFFWPVDEGILGVLSTDRYALDLTATGLIVAFILSIARGASLEFFSRRSAYFLLLFLDAVAVSATGAYALDVVMCVVVVACVANVFVRAIARETRYRDLSVRPLFQGAGIGTLLFAEAALGSRSGVGGVGASAAILLAARNRIGSCDVVLGSGAIGILASQTGSGFVSDVGWIALAATSIGIVIDVVRESRPGEARVS